MNDLKEGDILYYAFSHNRAICIGKHTFSGWSGNRMTVRSFSAGFDIQLQPKEQQNMFLTPIEAFENGLKKILRCVV